MPVYNPMLTAAAVGGDGTTLKLRPRGSADPGGELRLTRDATNGSVMTLTSADGLTGDVDLYRALATLTSAGVLKSDNPLNLGVANGSADTTVKLDAAGATGVYLNSSQRQYRDVAGFFALGAQTGTLKISLPVPTGAASAWSNTLLRVTIKGFNYADGFTEWEVTLGGYVYGGDNSWRFPTAEIRGGAPFTSVRVGWDSTAGRCCILLGAVDTAWNNPSVVISEVLANYQGVTGWGSGWTLGLVTSETGLAAKNTGGTPTGVPATANYPGVGAPDGTTLNLRPAGASNVGGEVRVTNDTNGGKFTFTDHAGSNPDTNLYRGGANLLKTDDSLTVGGALTLSADPVNALEAATRQFVLAQTGATPYLPLGLFPVVGKWVILPHFGSVAGFTPLANYTYFFPLPVNKSLTIDKVALNITAAGAGNYTFGVYSAGTDMQPVGEAGGSGGPKWTLGTVDASVLGTNPATVTGVTLAAGTMNWLALNTPATPGTLSGVQTYAGLAPYLWEAGTGGLPSLGTNMIGYRQSGAGLPNTPAPSPTGATQCPRVALLAK